MARALIAVGSNLGDRAAQVASAVEALGALKATRVLAASEAIETAPERPEDGAPFLNAAVLVETTLPPRALLEHLHEVEARLGRERVTPRRGPRTIDLDLIIYEGVVRREPGLEVPHPRFRSRRFVLEPAARIAPQMIDPVTRRTIADLLRLAPRPRSA